MDVTKLSIEVTGYGIYNVLVKYNDHVMYDNLCLDLEAALNDVRFVAGHLLRRLSEDKMSITESLPEVQPKG